MLTYNAGTMVPCKGSTDPQILPSLDPHSKTQSVTDNKMVTSSNYLRIVWVHFLFTKLPIPVMEETAKLSDLARLGFTQADSMAVGLCAPENRVDSDTDGNIKTSDP